MAQVTFTNVAGTSREGGLVAGFSLEVPDRGFVVLAGPEGCGACTVLRLLAGLEPVTEGQISVGSHEVTALPPLQRNVAFVFPGGALVPHWKVGRNIAFGLKGRHFPSSEIGKRVRQAAAVAGILEETLGRLPEALSPLERLRAALARAVIGQPKALLMDDPLPGLPEADRAEARAELVKLQERLQVTALYAANDPLAAMTLGHRVALLNGGKLMQEGEPLEVYRSPANRFAAGFLGKMNFLAGQLRAAKGGSGFMFKETGGTVELALPDRPELATLAGRELVLGVRPEHLRPTAAGDGNRRSASGQAVVDALEATGAELVYTLQTGVNTLKMLRPGTETPVGVGRRMAFDIEPAAVHLFDVISGERVG